MIENVRFKTLFKITDNLSVHFLSNIFQKSIKYERRCDGQIILYVKNIYSSLIKKGGALKQLYNINYMRIIS